MNRLIFASLTVIGFACVLLSSRKDWFYIPTGSFDVTSMHAELEPSRPRCQPVFQGLILLVTIGLVVSWLYRFRWNRLSVALTCSLLLIASTFPQAVMLSDPRVSGQATWLQMQYDNLLWVGGDISTSHELSRTSWKSKVYLIDAPRQVSVVRLPSWSPSQIGLERLPFMIEWLGYTDSFCQFVRTGWFLAMVGSAMLLMCTFVESGHMKIHNARQAIATISCGTIVLAICGWIAPLQASRSLEQCAHAISNNKMQDALESLENAAEWLPVLREDTYFIAQKGLLHHALGTKSTYSKIYSATLTEQDGFYAQALTHYMELIESDGTSESLKRESRRAVLRYAIHALNSGDTAGAIRHLQTVLRGEPCNLKAIYILQIAMLRSGELQKTKELVDHTYATCEYFRFPTKKVLLSASQQHATFAAMLEGDIDVTWNRFRKANRP